MTEHQIYEFYNDFVKPVYAEIEARDNSLPVELLFEIHAAFDHLKRIHIDEEDETLACEKAHSHLKRGLLDAFKLKLKFHNKEYAQIDRNNKALSLIDNGNFYPALLTARKTLISTAREARLNEGLRKGNEAYEAWFSVSRQIDKIENDFFLSDKLAWSSRQSFIKNKRDWFVGFASGFFSSLVVAGIVALIQYFGSR